MPDRSSPMRSAIRPAAAAHTRQPSPAATTYVAPANDDDGAMDDASFETIESLTASPEASEAPGVSQTSAQSHAPTGGNKTAAPQNPLHAQRTYSSRSIPAASPHPAARGVPGATAPSNGHIASPLTDAQLDDAWATHVPAIAWVRQLRDECVAAITAAEDFPSQVAGLRYAQLYFQWRELLCAAVQAAQCDRPDAAASELRAALLGELVQSLATLVDEEIVSDAKQLAGRIIGQCFTPSA